MEINLKNILEEDECKQYKKVVSKHGLQVVCDEEDEQEQKFAGAIILPDTPECESVVEVASKEGIKILCSDED